MAVFPEARRNSEFVRHALTASNAGQAGLGTAQRCLVFMGDIERYLASLEPRPTPATYALSRGYYEQVMQCMCALTPRRRV